MGARLAQEHPVDADMVIDTTDIGPDEAANQIILYLESQGYIGGAALRA